MKRHIAFAVLLLNATVVPVFGQGFYLVGGGGATFRAPGWSPSQATPLAPEPSMTSSIGGGAGVWLAPAFAVEGSIGLTRAQSIDWFYGYAFDETGGKRTDDRDIPLTGLIRGAIRYRAVSLEPVLGGGLTFHRGATFSTSDCGYGQFRTPCVMITPPQLDEVWTSVEPILTGGVDVGFRASRWVTIAPGFRLNLAQRPLYMTGYDHRGPYSGNGYFWSVGVSVRFSLH